MEEILIYFFYGTDDYRIRKKIEKIKLKHLNAQIDFNFDKLINPSVDDFLNIANSYPVFASSRVLLIEDFDDKFLNDKSVLNYATNPSNSTIVIFYKNSPKINENASLFKELKTKKYFKLSKIRTLYDNELPAYIKNMCKEKKLDITDEGIYYFLRLSGNSIINIENELNKLASLSKSKKTLSVKDIKSSVVLSRTFNIFDFIDGILVRDLKKAFNIFNLIYKEGEEPVKIVSILYNEFKKIHKAKLLEKSGMNFDTIITIIGVQSFLKNKFIKNMNAFSIKELERITDLLTDCDIKLKTSGFPGDLIIEEFIFKLGLIQFKAKPQFQPQES